MRLDLGLFIKVGSGSSFDVGFLPFVVVVEQVIVGEIMERNCYLIGVRAIRVADS